MIDSFIGEYQFLSNFYPASLVWDRIFFPTVEHAYQAAKTVNRRRRFLVAEEETPGSAKHMGRNFILRPDWEDIKLEIMRSLVIQKFNEHLDLGVKLLSTENIELVEGNTWDDTFWGICRGVGENHLGKILMQVRSDLRGIL